MQKVIQMSQRQISENGEEKSMSLQEVFLVNHSLSQAKEKERMITVTSGLKCSGLYGKSGQLGSLVRMLLESSRWYSPVRRLKWEVRPLYSERITEKEYCTDKNMLSKPFVETLNVKDTPSNRYLFRLVPSERRTEGIEFGLLPTVQTQGLKRCNSQGKTEFMPLELLPTPMATDIHHAERVAELKKRGAKGLRCRDKGEAGANGLTDWMDFHGMLPTPTARDYKGSASMESIQRRKRNHLTNNLSDVYAQRGKTSQLNPRFVSEMMGFPVDWTVLPFLNGGKNP